MIVKTKPLVSVIVLNWNRLQETLECLKHIRNLTYSNLEIIIVDNGSVDDSKQRLQQEKGIIFIDNPSNRGFTGGHIDGLQHAKGEFILLLNNDAVIKPDYIDKALPHFADSQVAAVGGRAYFWDDQYPALNETNPYYAYQEINPITAEGIFTQHDGEIVREVNMVSGSGVVIRRSVINEVGYLYEPFFAYYEETDLFARMKRAGYKILYSPELGIWHKNGSSSSPYFQFHQLFKNRFLFAVRNFDSVSLPKFLKSYAGTGIRSTIYRLKRSENQVLHKAFSNAFLKNLLLSPRAFASRYKLIRLLGKSSYNTQITKEQINVGIVLDLTNHSYNKLEHEIEQWLIASNNDPRLRFVVVHSSKLEPTIRQQYPNITFTHNKNYFKNQALNLGWLTSPEPYIVFLKSDFNKSILNSLFDKAATLKMSRTFVACSVADQGSNKNLYEARLMWGSVFDRSLLIHSGGLDVTSTQDEALRQVITYAWLKDKRSVKTYESESKQELLEAPRLNFKTVKKELLDKIHLHNSLDLKPTLWVRILERHYRIYQLRNLLRWWISLRIPVYLKLARTKNLFLFAFGFQRKKLAIELQHIRNEFLKISRKVDNDVIEKNIKHTLLQSQTSWQDIPVFIICRDRLTPLKKLVGWLEKLGMKKIVFIDNDSLYPPLNDYYETTPYQVLRTQQNIGHTVPWSGGIIKTLVPHDFYIVSDPDIIPTKDCPSDVLEHFLKLHEEFFLYQKIGFGLKIDDLPKGYTHKKSVIQWESQFWKKSLKPNVYEAGVDTTFALYKPYTYAYTLHPSIRTGEPYTAHHLPWYIENDGLTVEEEFYRAHASNEINSWNLDELPERYVKELSRQHNSD